MSVADADRRSAVAALDLDPLAADLVQVWFFDTPDLDLNASGVIVRARRTRARDDTTVKLRPVVPDDLPKGLRARSGFGVEIDAMPGRLRVLGAAEARSSSRARCGEGDARRQVRRASSSASAARVLRAVRPGRADPRRRASPSDRSPSLKLKFTPQGFDRAHGRRAVDLPGRLAHPRAVDQVRARRGVRRRRVQRAFLEGRGIDLTGVQQTKTKTALDYFAGELRDRGGR